ncbi:hypothetical protein ACWIUD_07875 [Helicobacter sp. 23-1044]
MRFCKNKFGIVAFFGIGLDLSANKIHANRRGFKRRFSEIHAQKKIHAIQYRFKRKKIHANLALFTIKIPADF